MSLKLLRRSARALALSALMCAPLAAFAAPELTLEKIMAHPDWIGRAPENAYFSADSKFIYYTRKAEGSELRDLWRVAVSGGTPEKLELAARSTAESDSLVWDQKRQRAAWLQNGNLFLRKGNRVSQLTRTGDLRQLIGFIAGDWLAWRSGNRIEAIHADTLQQVLWADLRLDDDPAKKDNGKDYLSQQQLRMFDIIKLRKQRETERRARDQQIAALASSAPAPFYLGKGKELRSLSLSPDGRYLIVGLGNPGTDGRADMMPHYVSEDGYVKPQNVRSKVGTDKPTAEALQLIDLRDRSQRDLGYGDLPGINEDPLLALKTETAKRAGKEAPKADAPRAVYVHNWLANGGIQWSDNAERVAIMLFSYDNKDRWLVEVDLANAKLQTRHRLTDNAWVNDSEFNEFGYLPDNTLWYLSEESGYGHLYAQKNGNTRALTSGKFEVNRVQMSADGEWLYYRANKAHPGRHEVYRVHTGNGRDETLTELAGGSEFVLSHDGRQLAILHSKMTQPTELFAQNAKPGSKPLQLTRTVNEEFAGIDWLEPEVIAVPSAHNAGQPVYARVYRDPSVTHTEKRPAVMFVHGAGYLQNVHYGWSTYFREFMFHQMLARQGYVVIDMDYRASEGYGRDWRTAIYQRMGTPELEDYLDGVEWLVANANVDRERIGIYGGSYGGFMAFMALFKTPDVFAAGAALRPVTDWAHYNHGYTANILNTPDVDPQAYERSSPIEFAANLKKPLLICTGMLDDNVFFQDSVRLVQRLIELKNANFDLAVYPIEPHGFREPESWLDEYRRIYRLFEKELRGVDVRFN